MITMYKFIPNDPYVKYLYLMILMYNSYSNDPYAKVVLVKTKSFWRYVIFSRHL